MRFKSGTTDEYLYFVAVDATDYVTRETGLATWTVVRSRNGAADVTYTTPTVTEIDSSTMPGVYALLLDEDMTLDAGDYTQEVCLHITHAGMAPVTRTFELYTEAEGDISDVLSHLTVVNSRVLVVKSDTSDILSAVTIVKSDTAVIETVTSDIQSDTNKLVSDATEVDTSDIQSLLTIVNSRVLVVKSDTSDIQSHLTVWDGAAGILSDIGSKVTRIHSDTITLASDLAEGDFSDILSRLTVTNSQVLIIKSDTSDIKSQLVIIASDAAHIESDCAADQIILSDVQSDTNVLVTKMRGVVLATGTIGATGNTTTVIHIPDAVLDSLSDDEIKYYNVVIYDVSLDEYHARTITAWTNTGDLATVSPALPFTPEASVDLYWIFPPWSNQFDYDPSDIYSLLTLVRSDTTVVETVTSDIQSDTNKLVSDATEVDTSDIQSLLTVVNSRVLVVKSDTSDIVSNLAAIEGAAGVLSDISSKVTRIHSDTITLASDLAEGDFSDILSRLTVTNSQVLIIKSDTSDIKSQLVIIASDAAHVESQTTRIHSDTITLASDLAEGDFSDILSRLTVTNSQLLVVKSDTSDIRSALVIIASDAAAIDSNVDKVYSDTTIISSDTALATDARAEPGQGTPAATATPQAKIDYLYKAWRNRTTQTATEYALYADDGLTKDQEAAVSDDGVTFERAEVQTGA